MDGIGKGLAEFFIFVAIICFIIGGGIAFIIRGKKPNSITVTHRIEPELKLIIKNNKVDTLYIYRKP